MNRKSVPMMMVVGLPGFKLMKVVTLGAIKATDSGRDSVSSS